MNPLQMEAAEYLQEYTSNNSSLSLARIQFFADRATELVFAYFAATGKCLREAVALLCHLNTADNPDWNRIGTDALFPCLIEKLNDSFTTEFSRLYDQIFSHVISFCRQLPAGQSLDSLLLQFQLPDESSLLARRQTLLATKNSLLPAAPIKRIIFLSRVTIGADVAITSVMIGYLAQLYPQAEIVILGAPKLLEIFGGMKNLRVRAVSYGRGSGLMNRLMNWIDVVTAIQDEVGNLRDDEFYVFDPDSRLTQLGLLPVLSPTFASKNYFYFPSRHYRADSAATLATLTATWLGEISSRFYAQATFLSLPAAIAQIGASVVSRLQQFTDRPVAVMSFGVGGNSAKRINDEFEIKLVSAVAQHAVIVLDKGVSDAERAQVDRIIASVAQPDLRIANLEEADFSNNLANLDFAPDILLWQGSIGSFAALIRSSDFYFGYDSSGQHFAAAAEIPFCTIFVNSGNEIFAQRWRPSAKLSEQIITLDAQKLNFKSEAVTRYMEMALQYFHRTIAEKNSVEKLVENSVEKM